MMPPLEMIFWLLAAHALMDYPLQGDFLAKGKNRHTPIIPGTAVWPYCLSAHSLLHGGAVAVITGSWVLGLAETLIHWAIDYGKCEGWYGFHVDQWLHIACKVLWVAAALWWVQ